VEGDIEVDGDVALGEESSVGGNVSGAQITVAGAVMGDLRAAKQCYQRGTRGSAICRAAHRHRGAPVRGGVRTEGEASAAPRRAAVAARRAPEFRRARFRLRQRSRLQRLP
jgi:cytoskeletal protein CcmA (bactofilin family)